MFEASRAKAPARKEAIEAAAMIVRARERLLRDLRTDHGGEDADACAALQVGDARVATLSAVGRLLNCRAANGAGIENFTRNGGSGLRHAHHLRYQTLPRRKRAVVALVRSPFT